jgi:hypothetical protein
LRAQPAAGNKGCADKPSALSAVVFKLGGVTPGDLGSDQNMVKAADSRSGDCWVIHSDPPPWPRFQDQFSAMAGFYLKGVHLSTPGGHHLYLPKLCQTIFPGSNGEMKFAVIDNDCRIAVCFRLNRQTCEAWR